MSRKVDHTNTVCIKCGRKDTYVNPKGRSEWFSDTDKNGMRTGRYVCSYCYRGIGAPRIKKDTSNRKCCICGKGETFVDNSEYAHWLKEYNERKVFTGRYICTKCDAEKRNKDGNSYRNLIKSMTMSRLEELSIEDNKGKGLIGEAIIGKVRGLKVLGIETGNINFKFDLSTDKEYGIIQSKLRKPLYGDWKIYLGRDDDFDTLLVLCMDKYMKNVVRVYAIPKKELKGLTGITLCKNPLPSVGSKWEKFMIDEKPYDGTYQNIILHLKHKKFGIEKIKKWLDNLE